MEASIPRKLWEHPNPEDTQLWKFTKALAARYRTPLPDYESVHRFSCTRRSDFWRHAFDYFPIIYEGTVPDPVVDESARIDSVPRWFQGVKLNFAENVLFSRDEHGLQGKVPGKEDDKIACVEVREGCFTEPIKHVTWKELRERVGWLSQAMRLHGVQKGDRVAVVSSVSLDTLTVFLAVTSLGGIFSSTSTDMAPKGILERLLQIKPKFLFMDDTTVYNGKRIDLRPKMKEVILGMKSVAEFEGIVSQPRFASSPADVSTIPLCQTWSTFISRAKSRTLVFNRVDFSDPFLIVYSSGTTGTPKCIVHSVGAVILNGHKEGRLHRELDHTSTQLQYTTTSWIMYMTTVVAMLAGTSIVMYDGSPFYPNINNYIQLWGQEKITHLGTSPRYLQTLQANKLVPKQLTDLSRLKVVTSTGMVLPDAVFEWFYDIGFPPSVQLDNIAGGTDLAGAFGTGNPLLPVYVGGCQSLSLGMAVSVFDPTIEGGKGVKGKAVEDGVPGELVCTAAFPTMPIKFWGDEDGQRYFSSYFEKYDNCWTHGDFIMIHPVTKQVFFLGRADGVLNPSGVRFGSAEIYSIIDANFSDEIADSICVGQRRPKDADESVMLFVLMKPGKSFTPDLVRRLKQSIKTEATPRHVPKYIFETPDIPTTVNLKKVELPVKQIVSGKIIKPSSTLANPESLNYYYKFAKDENLVTEPIAKL